MLDPRSPWLRALAAVAVVHLVLLGFDLSPWDAITKCFIAPILVVWVWRSGGPRRIVDALVLCFFGDLFIELDGLFELGMLAFAAAHVCFITWFWEHGARERVRERWWIAAVYAILAVGLLVGAWTGLPLSLQLAMPLYAVLLVATATTSAVVDRLAGWGGLLFLASDGLIALGAADRLDADFFAWRLAVMVLYIPAIVLLATGAMRVDSSASDPAAVR